MFAHYKAQVTLAYKKKKTSGELSLNLSHSTPAKLRAECVIVLNERYLKSDENTLRVFFGPKDGAHVYMQAIRKFDADKFKPLDNFLKGITNDTDDKNIELLAWLIDFEPRPYRFGRVNVVSEPEIIYGKEIGGLSNNKTEGTSYADFTNDAVKQGDDVNGDVKAGYQQTNKEPKPRVTLNVKNGIFLIAVTGIVGMGICWAFRHKKVNSNVVYTTALGNQKCMYWTGDNYQPVSCNQKVENIIVIALDTERLYHFKRVTEPDTVTENSIGKLWYFRIKEHVELYTAPGIHPVFFDRRLLPLSRAVLNKYMLHIKDSVVIY